MNNPKIIATGVLDRTLEAWLLSKPNIKYNSDEEAEAEINKLITANLPISGFKIYYLKITSSIYFRDLLFSFRPMMPWAQSFRNKPIEDESVQISSECSTQDYYQTHIQKLNELKIRSKSGEALDVIKRYLPVTTLTSYSFFIDRRTLITIVKTLEDLSSELFSIYGKLLLEACSISMEQYKSTKVFGILDKLLITQKLELNSNERSKVIPILDSDIYFSVNFEFATAAQFLRQHFSKIRYLEFNRIKTFGYFNCLNKFCTDRTQVSVLSDLVSFNRTISRRLCWFANFDRIDHDSWAVILDDFMTKIKDQKEFENLLPCKGCSDNCDIFEEFKLRAKKLGDPNLKDGLTSADRNEICPILRDKLCPTRPISDIFKSREESQGSNSETFRMWKEIYGTESEKSILSELFGI